MMYSVGREIKRENDLKFKTRWVILEYE